jgi:KDO2-lipid IV(A) lauroyltransferase
MGGHVMLPPGPVKLAMATGAPIVPVCAPRGPDGRIHIVMEEPIWIDESEGRECGPHPAELKLGKVLEGWVRRYPEQWLMIQRVWCEDQVVPRKHE